MTVAGARYHLTSTRTSRGGSLRRWLLVSGIIGAGLYPLADIIATLRYPGFSYRDQAVSELFAIGAPTSGLIVPLFTLSSALLLAFAVGIWRSANERRVVRAMAVMMALNAIDALVLWNVFPMHQRGQEPTLTDGLPNVALVRCAARDKETVTERPSRLPLVERGVPGTRRVADAPRGGSQATPAHSPARGSREPPR